MAARERQAGGLGLGKPAKMNACEGRQKRPLAIEGQTANRSPGQGGGALIE